MRLVLAVAALLLALAAAAASAPLAHAHGGGAALPGDTLARARELGAPPARVFEDLEAGAPHYYRVHLTDDATLRIVAPSGARPAGELYVYVLGADLPNATYIPPGIEKPDEWGALVFLAGDDGTHLDARIPMSYELLLERDASPGERVVVLVSDTAARVAILAEEPGVVWEDFALMPSLRGDTRAWAGAPAWQPWLVGAAGAVAALAPFRRLRGRAWPLAGLLGAFAAATFGASTALLLADATRIGHAPWLLVLVGAALTFATTVAATRRRPTWRVRAALLACGVVGVVSWSGFLWGPVAAMAGALIPEPETHPAPASP